MGHQAIPLMDHENSNDATKNSQKSPLCSTYSYTQPKFLNHSAYDYLMIY